MPSAVADGQKVVPETRCDYPDRPFGCETDEFGSGFAEPESPAACNSPGGDAEASEGARRPGVEALIQTITDQIMVRIGKV